MEPFKNTKRYYVHGAILRILSVFLIGKALVDLICYKHYKSLFEAQSADYLGYSRAVTFVGTPGSGKTFSATEFAVIVANSQWEKLRSDYLLQTEMLPRWIATGDTDKLLSYEALKESYEFYVERESFAIPCLVSSVPVMDIYGRKSYELTDEVALQLKRVPEYSVLFNDESGLSQGANTSRGATSDILDFYRCFRHFGDFILINTEQGGDGNGKYIRKVTDYNIRLRRQEVKMSPYWAEKRYQRAKSRFFRKLSKGKLSEEKTQFLGEKLYFRGLYLKTIGFREIPYRFESSEGNYVELETGKYIFPREGIGKYDSRSYRLLYKCRKDPIDLSVWNTMLVDENNPHKYKKEISA